MPRTADELLNVPDPAWPLVLAHIAKGGTNAVVLPGEGDAGRRQIEALQVTARSVLGALAFHTGGLLVDHAWLRVLGCGHPQCTLSIRSATALLGWVDDEGTAPPGVVVGADVLGGVFAINCGGIAADGLNHVHYFTPDSLEWEDLELGHAEWVMAMLDGEVRAKFYEDVRWSGWENECAALADNSGLSIAPPLFTGESRPIERASRRGVPIEELIGFGLDMARQLDE